MHEISESEAQAAVAMALDKAREMGVAVSVAILDSGRNLIAFLRMTGAPLATIEVSQAKAYTAGSVNLRTAELAPNVLPGAAFYGFEVSHRHPMVVFGGGVPIQRGGNLIGAVGVAGGSIDEDVSLSEAVSDFLAKSRQPAPA